MSSRQPWSWDGPGPGLDIPVVSGPAAAAVEVPPPRPVRWTRGLLMTGAFLLLVLFVTGGLLLKMAAVQFAPVPPKTTGRPQPSAATLAALAAADRSVPGVRVFLSPTHRHTPGRVDYGKNPPAGGDHNPVGQSCAVYTEQVPSERAVHSMEHGAVWVTYRPDLPTDQIALLTARVDGVLFRMLSPFPGQDTPISLQAWGRQVTAETAGAPQVEAFLSAYTHGPQTPEPKAACSGLTATGTVSPPEPGLPPSASPSPGVLRAARPF